jgi:type IV secretion system protein VirB6
MEINFFSEIFTNIDNIKNTFVGDISHQLAVELTPPITAALTLSFIFYLAAILYGKIEEPFEDFIARSVQIMLISVFALGSGIYQPQIAPLIQSTPDSLAAAIIDNPAGPITAGNMLDRAAVTIFSVAGEAFSNAGLFSDEGWAFGITGLLITLMGAILLGIGTAFLLVGKIGLSVLAAMGPLFIASLLWRPTAALFDRWIGQILTYSFLIILFSIVFSFLISMFESFMAGFSIAETENLAMNLGLSCVLAMISILLLLELPGLAATLGHGFTNTFWHLRSHGIRRSATPRPPRSDPAPKPSLPASTPVASPGVRPPNRLALPPPHSVAWHGSTRSSGGYQGGVTTSTVRTNAAGAGRSSSASTPGASADARGGSAASSAGQGAAAYPYPNRLALPPPPGYRGNNPYMAPAGSKWDGKGNRIS